MHYDLCKQMILFSHFWDCCTQITIFLPFFEYDMPSTSQQKNPGRKQSITSSNSTISFMSPSVIAIFKHSSPTNVGIVTENTHLNAIFLSFGRNTHMITIYFPSAVLIENVRSGQSSLFVPFVMSTLIT